MPLPLIPIAIALGSASIGAALHAWLNQSHDEWEDKDVFNDRMQGLQRLGEALNTGIANCPAFKADNAQLLAWRGARDSFVKFYSDTGRLEWSSPDEAQIAQAKHYTSQFYFWNDEYNRKKCGSALAGSGKDPSAEATKPAPDATAWTSADYITLVKWGGATIGGLVLAKTLNDIFGRRR